jgi:putative membrane protein
MMRFGMGGYSGIGMLLGGILVLLVIAVLVALAIVGIVLLVRHGKSSGKANGSALMPNVSQALTVLDERYAKGEIDDEEYTKKKEMLKKQ